MKRLSRTAWLILGIGILVIVLGSLGTIYRTQASEQKELTSQLGMAQATLPKLASEKEALESQLTQLGKKLTQTTSLLNQAESKFPESVESVDYDEALFRIADNCDLEITKLTASDARDKEVEDITFSIASFSGEVEGEVVDILDFVDAIATGKDFANANVELVNIKVPEPLTEEDKEEMTDEEIEEAEMPSATIELTIYGYRGE